MTGNVRKIKKIPRIHLRFPHITLSLSKGIHLNSKEPKP